MAADISPRLPAEILDMIIDHLQFCLIEGPNQSFPPASDSTHLLPFRLVNRAFNERLLPTLFRSLKLGPGHEPTQEPSLRLPFLKATGEPLPEDEKQTRDPTKRLQLLLHSPSPGVTSMHTVRLADYIVSLHLTVYPTLGCTHLTTPAAYFTQLRRTLPGLLAPLQALNTLNIDANYTGLAPEDVAIAASRAHASPYSLQPGGSPIFVCRPQLRASLLLHECFTALVDGVRDAHLARLELLQLGVPYEGGYGDFFEREGRARVSHARLSTGAPKLQRASVKLFNELGDWTIMRVF